jgi:aerobic C4-dicarboxylate transport protein
LLVGIDRIMSEGRSLTNAVGNAVAVMVIARWRGERDEPRFQAALNDPSLVRQQIEVSGDGHAATADAADDTLASSGRVPSGSSPAR